MKKLFGTNGIRGITNRDITPELALGMGKAIGTYFKEGARILVARDARTGGDMLVSALISGLLSAGIEVHYGGKLPTPGLQYNVRLGKYDGGVIITASHNPAEFNGIKVVDSDGVEAAKSSEERIEQIYFSGKFRNLDWQKLGRDMVVEEGLVDRYVDGILKRVDSGKIKKKQFRVLIDGGNSVGSLSSVKIAKWLGCEVHEVNTNLDPLFSGRTPEPTPKSLENTVELAKKLKVDIAVAHDGDADRAVFIDSKGRVQMGDRSGVLLSYWISKRNAGVDMKVVTPFSSSDMVEEFLTERKISTTWTRIGSEYVSRELLTHGGMAGFEDNGGFIYPAHQYVRDGGMAFALMLELLANENKSSAQLFDMLPSYYSEKIKIPLTERMDVDATLERIRKAYAKKGKVVDTDNDGLKLVGKDFWFIVRKSGTEPVLRMSVEAKKENVLRETMDSLKSLV